MFPSDPLAAIAHMPYVLDAAPRNVLMIAGFDDAGVLRHTASSSLDSTRPLDEPLLESSLWQDDISFAAAVAYSADERVPLQPLIDAWAYRGRETLSAVWAGATQWRDYLCASPNCCSGAPHRYSAAAPHPVFDPVGTLSDSPAAWRRSQWNRWCAAIDRQSDTETAGPELLEQLSLSLFDIPIRDAVLAHSAAPGVGAQPGITAILESITERSVAGVTAPAYTCLAAMYYLESNFEACGALVRDVLEVQEYSFARLLLNGLEMRAPASLLARSFATFNPQDLLAA